MDVLLCLLLYVIVDVRLEHKAVTIETQHIVVGKSIHPGSHTSKNIEKRSSSQILMVRRNVILHNAT